MNDEELFVLKVKKEDGERAMEEVKLRGILDTTRIPRESGEYLLIPVTEGGERIHGELESREPRRSPFHRICSRLDLPQDMLPARWELIGDVLLFKLPEELYPERDIIGETYAEVLGAKTVLLQGPIHGVTRKPEVEVVFGGETETVHVENCIRYMLDAAGIMFSSGNIEERQHMARVVKDGEVVVDMFAGIGYFTLPMAVYGEAAVIHGVEINPVAHGYLCRNISLNGVEGVVKAHLGDNREFELDEPADRVVMGYLHHTERFLPKALEFIKGEGIIHYHCNVKEGNMEEKVREQLKPFVSDYRLTDMRKIKSYAPHIYHVVADIVVG